MSIGPTFQHIRALVEELRPRARGVTTFGCYSTSRYTDQRLVRSGDELYCVAHDAGLVQQRRALAQVLGVPPFRLATVLAVVRRVLNVDGYPVLSRDEASRTVELNRDLLLRQFELSGDST